MLKQNMSNEFRFNAVEPDVKKIRQNDNPARRFQFDQKREC
ncbi:hypothetical protein ACMYR2_3671 [Nitrobacter sp. TKz-YC01]